MLAWLSSRGRSLSQAVRNGRRQLLADLVDGCSARTALAYAASELIKDEAKAARFGLALGYLLEARPGEDGETFTDHLNHLTVMADEHLSRVAGRVADRRFGPDLDAEALAEAGETLAYVELRRNLVGYLRKITKDGFVDDVTDEFRAELAAVVAVATFRAEPVRAGD